MTLKHHGLASIKPSWNDSRRRLRFPQPRAAMSTNTFITTAPKDVAAWVQAIEQREIPVLDETAALIETLRELEDGVDAHVLAEDLGIDPLMTLKLLRQAALLPRSAWRERSDAETVTQALVLMGITPFFRQFGLQPGAQQRLQDLPQALAGLEAVLRRSQRAAAFALAFAVHRQDYDAPVLHQAALLHDFAEMLLWVHAPQLALALAQDLHGHPGLRSTEAQRQHLNVTLNDLQLALMRRWHLPDLLVRVSDDAASTAAQVRNVQLAVRVARHSADGWENPALTLDVEELTELLNMAAVPTWTLLHHIDDEPVAPVPAEAGS